MTRSEALQKIKSITPELAAYDVKMLSMFGSIARDESTPGSDIDFIVEFNGKATFDKYFGLLVFLEDSLGVKVDLAQPETIRSQIRDRVLAEAVRVA